MHKKWGKHLHLNVLQCHFKNTISCSDTPTSGIWSFLGFVGELTHIELKLRPPVVRMPVYESKRNRTNHNDKAGAQLGDRLVGMQSHFNICDGLAFDNSIVRIEFKECSRLRHRAARLILDKHEHIHQDRLQVNSVTRARHGNGKGLLFHMTQPTSRSTIKAIACSKPTINEN